MILNYNHFILEKHIQLISESLVYMSKKLEKFLTKIVEEGGPASEIAQEIINLKGVNIDADVTFLDVDDADGCLSFRRMDAFITKTKDHPSPSMRKIPTEYNPALVNYLGDDIFKKGHNPIKITKFINTVLNKKYDQKDIDNFINQFKILQREKVKVDIVEGEQIKYWYNSSNCKTKTYTLGDSCMSHPSKAGFLNIYAENPETCKLAIITESDKLVARALLWKIENSNKGNFEWFLDRRYVIDDTYNVELEKWAKESGYAWRTHNKITEDKGVSFGDQNFEDVEMSVKVNPGKFDYYPYADTFSIYDPKEGFLYNNWNENAGFLKLKETDGRAQLLSGSGDKVYSMYYRMDIALSDATYSDALGDWLYSGRTRYIMNGTRRGLYPSEHPEIIQEYLQGEYYHQRDCVVGLYGWIPKDNALQIVTKVSENGEIPFNHSIQGMNWINKFDFQKYVYLRDGMPWVKFLRSKYPDWKNCQVILRDLVTTDYIGEFALKDFTIKAWKTNHEELEFLDEIDSIALDIDIEKDETYTLDLFSYCNKIIAEIGLEEWLEKLEEIDNEKIEMIDVDRKIRKVKRIYE